MNDSLLIFELRCHIDYDMLFFMKTPLLNFPIYKQHVKRQLAERIECPECHCKSMILNKFFMYAVFRYQCPKCYTKIDVGPPQPEAA